MTNIYEQHLDRNPANHVPLSPLSYLERSALVFPDKTAVIHGVNGERSYTWSEVYTRARRLASALSKRGIGTGDTVSIMATNTPEMLEAHFGVPATGAVLNALNYRLDAANLSFILNHCESKLLITDREFAPTIKAALADLGRSIPVIDIDDPVYEGDGELLGEKDYEALLEEGDPDFPWEVPEDEWQAITLNYTSGTTGNPKGVVLHHRGAYLNAIGNAYTFNVRADSRYLWTLPMFHCNGWTFTWGVTAAGGTHVCLRAVDPAKIFPLIANHNVTHMCGAPIVLTMLIHAPDEVKQSFPQTVETATGGAAPPSAVIRKMGDMGFHVVHLYGLTECYGPATVCEWKDAWNDLSMDEQAAMAARQGVEYVTLESMSVRDPDTMDPVPRDGETIGEIMLRGNTVMKGYLKNADASDAAFKGGWFHTGDLAVMHDDGYAEVKDRSKDIIISGGENISSLEVEEVLYKHPEIMEAAVVARPDEKWGETPCAFVTPKSGANLTAETVIAYCRENMARYKVPKTIVFGELPKTSTGKIQKFVLRETARNL